MLSKERSLSRSSALPVNEWTTPPVNLKKQGKEPGLSFFYHLITALTVTISDLPWKFAQLGINGNIKALFEELKEKKWSWKDNGIKLKLISINCLIMKKLNKKYFL